MRRGLQGHVDPSLIYPRTLNRISIGILTRPLKRGATLLLLGHVSVTMKDKDSFPRLIHKMYTCGFDLRSTDISMCVAELPALADLVIPA